MGNLFKVAHGRMSAFILLAWPIAVLLTIISAILMVEDYMTSFYGYQSLPTAKVGEYWVPMAVAAIPQAGQILMAFVFGRNTDKKWAIWVAAGLFLVDISTDVSFKMNGNPNLIPLAVAESFFIFTLGSEIMFSLAGGIVLETFQEFISVSIQFISSLTSTFTDNAEHIAKSFNKNNSYYKKDKNYN